MRRLSAMGVEAESEAAIAAADRKAIAYVSVPPGKASMFSIRRIITSLFLALDARAARGWPTGESVSLGWS